MTFTFCTVLLIFFQNFKCSSSTSATSEDLESLLVLQSLNDEDQVLERIRLLFEFSGKTVGAKEIENWIYSSFKNQSLSYLEEDWAEINPEKNEIQLEEYLNYKNQMGPDGLAGDEFSILDTDSNGMVSKEEYKSMLVPHENTKLKHLYTKESFDAMDSNNDGKLSLEEFKAVEGTAEPPEDLFEQKLDKDGDGYVDIDELANHTFQATEGLSEKSSYLLEKFDENNDGVLDYEEVKEAFYLVGSASVEKL